MVCGMAITSSFVNVKMLLPVKIPGEFFNFKCIVGLQLPFFESVNLQNLE